jgi:hypothetical protein
MPYGSAFGLSFLVSMIDWPRLALILPGVNSTPDFSTSIVAD